FIHHWHKIQTPFPGILQDRFLSLENIQTIGRRIQAPLSRSRRRFSRPMTNPNFFALPIKFSTCDSLPCKRATDPAGGGAVCTRRALRARKKKRSPGRNRGFERSSCLNPASASTAPYRRPYCCCKDSDRASTQRAARGGCPSCRGRAAGGCR